MKRVAVICSVLFFFSSYPDRALVRKHAFKLLARRKASMRDRNLDQESQERAARRLKKRRLERSTRLHRRSLKNYVSDSLFDHIKERTGLSSGHLRNILAFWKKREETLVPAFRQQYGVLPQLIQAHNLKSGCEVGVFFGTQSAEILRCANIEKLYSVDPYCVSGDPTWYDGKSFLNRVSQDQFDVLYAIALDRLTPFGDRSVLMRDWSVNAAKQFQDHELDFVYLDGDHSYKGVRDDLHAWWRVIRPGGYMCGDDYCEGWPGVVRAVSEFSRQHNLTVHKVGIRMFLIQKPA